MDIWNNIKTGLLKTTEEVCSTTRSHHWPRATWWWNEHVGEIIAAKQQAFKAWETGKGTGASSMQPNALPEVQCTMLAKRPTRRSTRILTKSSEVYSLANQF